MDCTEAVTGMTLQNKHIPEFCQGCVLGKSHCHNFVSQPIRTPSSTPGYLIHADICGPMAHVSLGGALYYLLFKDDYSGYQHMILLHCWEIWRPSMFVGCLQMTFFETLETTCRFFVHMEVGSSPARNFKITFLTNVFDMKILHPTHQSKMASVSGTIAPLWKVSALSSTLVHFLWVFGLKHVTWLCTPSIVLVLAWFLEIHILLSGMVSNPLGPDC